MVDSRDEDDLFKHTAMTFGEHLEELRSSLLKAVLSLTVGFGIGLWFAPTIVQWIQSPLEIALREFYSKEAEEYLDTHLPPELRADTSIRKLVTDEGLIPQETFVVPGELLKQLQQKYPQVVVDGVELPAGDAATTDDPGGTGRRRELEGNRERGELLAAK